MADLFDGVAFITAPPHRVSSLLRAGVLDSVGIVILAGEHHHESGSRMQDSSTLILCSTVENLLASKPVEERPFVMYEFLNDGAVSLLPPLSPIQAAPGKDDDESDDDDSSPAGLQLHPRYLAGQFFGPDFFGTLIGRMYYLPATIEVVE